MNEDEWEEEASRILQEEIDREIIAEMHIQDLISKGWTPVEVSSGNMDYDEIDQWMQESIGIESCVYHWIYDTWVFKHADDATLFKMRWL
jgi:outer membrane protease